jgi:hypothetical protein
VKKQEEQKVIAVLQAWAADHPAPDQPILQLAYGKQYSANQIVREIRRHSAAGQTLLKMFDLALRSYPLQEVLDSFRTKSSRQAAEETAAVAGAH